MVTRKTRLMSALLAILMVVSMLTAFVLPAVAETDLSGLPLASKFAENKTAEGYRIVTKADMEAVGTNAASFTASQKLYLMNDLDMTGSTFTGTTGLKANFYGNNHTISNMDFTGPSMFYMFEGTEIKDLIIVDSDIIGTADAKRTGFLAGQYNGTDLTVDNVHILNSSFVFNSTDVYAGAFFVSRNAKGGAKITVTNSGLDSSTFDCNNKASNAGLIFGQTVSSANYFAQNIYVTNNKMINCGGATIGLFSGCSEQNSKMTVTNVVLSGNTLSGASATWYNAQVFIGQVKQTVLTATRVATIGNHYDFDTVDDAGKIGANWNTDNKSEANKYSGSLTDYYTDRASVNMNAHYTSLTQTNVQKSLNSGDVARIAFELNAKAAETDYKWEVAEDGTIVRDTDGKGLPFAVTVEVTDGVTGSALESVTAYTNANGQVVAPSTVVLTDATKVYTAGGTETAKATQWPLASAYAENTTSKGFIINSVATLQAGHVNAANFTADQTLYLTADLELAGVTAQHYFSGLKANFDGGNHTIYRYVSNGAFFRTPTSKSIKNVALNNALVTLAYGGNGLFINGVSSVDLMLEGVDLIDCELALAFAAESQYNVGGLIARCNDGNKTITIKDCRLIRTDITNNEAYTVGNTGLVVGQVRNGSVVTISNVLVEDCHADVIGGAANGLFVGCVEGGGKLKADNISLLNSSLSGKTSNGGLFVGLMKGNGSAITASDVLLRDSTYSATASNTGSIGIGYVTDASHLVLNNFAMIDCTRENGAGGYYQSGALIGHVYGDKDKETTTNDPKFNLKNVVIFGTKDENRTYSWPFNANGSSMLVNFDASSYANSFTDLDALTNHGSYKNTSNLQAKLTAEDYAMIAYSVNNDPNLVLSATETIASTNKWEVTADGKLAVDTDNQGLPAKVTLQITDELNNTDLDPIIAYTDVDGKLVGLDTKYLEKHYIWEKDLTGSFTEDQTVKGRMLTYTDLKNKVEYFNGKNSQYFTNGTDTALDVTLAAIKAEVDAYSYTTQADIQADYATLAAYEYKEGAEIAMSEYATYPDAPVLTISTVGELHTAMSNAGKYAETQTLKLLKSLDLDGAELNGFRSMKASFDGCGYTISNAKMASNIAFFNTYQGTSIKNLTLYKVTTTGNGNTKGVLMNQYNVAGKTLNLENVHLEECVLTATNTATAWHFGLLIGGVFNSDVNVADCSVKNSVLTHNATEVAVGNAGLMIGTIRGTGTIVNITDFELIGNELSIYYGINDYAGLAIGGVEYTDNTANSAGTLNINNMLIQDNTRKNFGMGWYNRSLLIGFVKGDKDGDAIDEGKAKVNINNVIAIENDNGKAENAWADRVHDDMTADEWLEWSPIVNIQDGADVENSNISYVYSDGSHISSSNRADTDGTSKAEVTAADYGMMAYAINDNLSVQIDNNLTLTSTTKYEVTAEGKLAIDEDGAGLPVAVTFEGVEPENAENNVTEVLYTKVDGTLVGLTAELLAAADWAETVDETTVFAQAATVQGDIMPEHECVMDDYIDHQNGTHTPTCSKEWDSVKGGKFGCEEVGTTVSCEATYGAWSETNPPTTEEEGDKERTCTACGYVDTAKIPVLMSIQIGEAEGYVDEELALDVKISGNTGINGGVLTITYDATKLEWKGADIKVGDVNNGSGSLTVTPTITEGVGVVKLAVAGYETFNGTDLMTLTFTAKAPGEASIAIESDFADFNGEAVGCADYSGSVTVYDFVRGDVNGDKTVNIADAVLMLRLVNDDQELNRENLKVKAADVNNDDDITVADVIKMLQFLTEFISEL